MDLASLIGIILGIVLMIFGIINGDQGVAALGNFVDGSSVLITIGGSLAGVIASHTMSDFITGLKSFTLVFKIPKADVGEVIKHIIDLSNIARKEGLLALEEAANGIEDEFLKKGVMLVVDGTDPELVRGIMEADLMCVESRHKTTIGFWEKWAALGPAWGMIGTLIGLVNMLYNMDDMAMIGPNMAVALLTTLYGSLLANWICVPVSFKLQMFNGMEITIKEIMVEGLLSIQAGENPRVIEEKLKSFLAPNAREEIGAEEGGASAAAGGGEA